MARRTGGAAGLTREAAAILRRAARFSPQEAYLVGGAVRDALLGRATRDLDLAAKSPRALAGKLARALEGRLVVLDEANAVYRVCLGPRFKTVSQIDVAAIQGRGIQEDLARRDFTLNAMALPLGLDSGLLVPAELLIDPRGGLADLSRRLIRCESESLFTEDPLRLLRAFRIAAQLEFSIEPKTFRMIARLRHRIRRPAGERIQAELMALLSVPGCSLRLKEMDEARLLTALFDDLEPARKCALEYYGPGGVLAHCLETSSRADFLLNHLPEVFPEGAAEIEERLRGRSKGCASLKPLLILSALLHDVAKAETARRVGGRLRFFGHDKLGAKRAETILRGLRFSRDHIATSSAVIANHLRPGNLAGAETITDKAVYRFFRDMGDEALSLLLVCWADHASYLPETRLLKLLKASRAPLEEKPSRALLSQPEAVRKTVRHLRVITHLLRHLFDQSRQALPGRLIDGNEVMRTLGIPPGPAVGKWLERLREAQAVGKVSSRQEALSYLRKAK